MVCMLSTQIFVIAIESFFGKHIYLDSKDACMMVGCSYAWSHVIVYEQNNP